MRISRPLKKSGYDRGLRRPLQRQSLRSLPLSLAVLAGKELSCVLGPAGILMVLPRTLRFRRSLRPCSWSFLSSLLGTKLPHDGEASPRLGLSADSPCGKISLSL